MPQSGRFAKSFGQWPRSCLQPCPPTNRGARMPIPSPRFIRLLQALVERTEEGRIHWTSGDDPTSFGVSLPSTSILIQSVDGDGEAPFRVSLADSNGVTIESFESESPMDYPPETRSDIERLNRALRQLYEGARRNALGIDKILDA